MYRVDGSTAAAALPAPNAVSGTPGYFSDGDPATATPPTTVTAEWLNMVQEEIVAVIAATGAGLSKADRGQLNAAIGALIVAAAAPRARQILAGGLATGGGDLTTDRTITVSAASDAEAIAGALSNKALTPHSGAALVADRVAALVASAPAALNTLKELADALGDDPNFAATINAALAARALAARQITGAGLASGGGSLAADRTITVSAASGNDLNAASDGGKALTPAAYGAAGGGDWQRGWTILPGGFIEQWGSEIVPASGGSSTGFTFGFPVAFALGCGSITGNGSDSSGPGWRPLTVTFPSLSSSGAEGRIDSTDAGHTLGVARTVYWRAVGK